VLTRLFTSESVTEGHPDKVCDAISDSILDALLREDPRSRVAVETMVTTGQVHVAGEITSQAYVDIASIVRRRLLDIGYDSSAVGFDGNSCGVNIAIGAQSPDIAQGVDRAEEHGASVTDDAVARQGAGDQGLMFGYACTETPELMPMPIMLAHKLVMRLAERRKSGALDYLRPDGKSQVSIRYVDGVPRAVETVVVSTQHSPEVGAQRIREDVIEQVIKPTIAAELIDLQRCVIHVNPTGRFVTGGPMGDTGLTGRKIIVDTYGGSCPHGGGAFSGKDPTKVDRSACYMARHVAKNVVAAGLALRAQVQVAYAIGVAEPVSVMVDTFGTGKIPNRVLEAMIRRHFDFTPAGIIKYLDLRRPIYKKTAAYGHFGRSEPDFAWERTNRVKDLRDDAGV